MTAAGAIRDGQTHQGEEVTQVSSTRVTNLVPIWSPSDSVDVAEAFAAEIANAERGVIVESGPYRAPRLKLAPEVNGKSRLDFLMTRSRERKARAMDALAVSMLMLLMAGFGAAIYFASLPR